MGLGLVSVSSSESLLSGFALLAADDKGGVSSSPCFPSPSFASVVSVSKEDKAAEAGDDKEDDDEEDDDELEEDSDATGARVFVTILGFICSAKISRCDFGRSLNLGYCLATSGLRKISLVFATSMQDHRCTARDGFLSASSPVMYGSRDT